MKRFLIALSAITMTACASLNPITLDSLAYSQYVGLSWLSHKMSDSCDESSNIDSNLPLLVARSEELLIYAQHRNSSSTEMTNAKELVKSSTEFMTKYRGEPDLKAKQAICKTESVKLNETIDRILDSLGGKTH